MNCNKCNTEAVENVANNNRFWYCRKCKEEVLESVIPIEYNSSQSDLEKSIEIAMSEIFRSMTSTCGL
jgi:ribosomal protein L37AE/L43A